MQGRQSYVLTAVAVVAVALVAAGSAGAATTTATGVSNAQVTADGGPAVEWAVASQGTIYVRFSTPLDPASVSAADFDVATERTGSVDVRLRDDDGDRFVALEVGEAAAPGYRTVLDVGEVASASGNATAPGSGPVTSLGTAVVQGGANGNATAAATVHRGEPLSVRSGAPNATVRIRNVDTGEALVEGTTGPTGVTTIDSASLEPDATYRATFEADGSASAQFFAVREPAFDAAVERRAVEVPDAVSYGAATGRSDGLVAFAVVDGSGEVVDEYPARVDANGAATGTTVLDRPGTYAIRASNLETGVEATATPVTAVQGAVVAEGGGNDATDAARTVYAGDGLAVRANRSNATVALERVDQATTVASATTGANGVATFDTGSIETGRTYRVAFEDGGAAQYVTVRSLEVGVGVADRSLEPGDDVRLQAVADRGDSPVRVALLNDTGGVVESAVRDWGAGTLNATVPVESPGTYRVRVTDLSTGVRATSDPVQVEESGGGTGPPVVTGEEPTDPDGDGRYEDVNGNGDGDLADAVGLYQHRDSAAVTDNVDAFDFSGNGEIDLADVVQLFQEVTG